MHNWFECKVKYEKTSTEGKVVKVMESYLVDALSFTEAEERIIKEMKPFISGEFQVSNVRRARIAELFYNENGDKWYRAKLAYITLDEERGIEKLTPSVVFVQANDFKEAYNGIETGMKGSMADWVLISLAETSILEVFKYTEN